MTVYRKLIGEGNGVYNICRSKKICQEYSKMPLEEIKVYSRKVYSLYVKWCHIP